MVTTTESGTMPGWVLRKATYASWVSEMILSVQAGSLRNSVVYVWTAWPGGVGMWGSRVWGPRMVGCEPESQAYVTSIQTEEVYGNIIQPPAGLGQPHTPQPVPAVLAASALVQAEQVAAPGLSEKAVTPASLHFRQGLPRLRFAPNWPTAQMLQPEPLAVPLFNVPP
jgi:hypothetical protein